MELSYRSLRLALLLLLSIAAFLVILDPSSTLVSESKQEYAISPWFLELDDKRHLTLNPMDLVSNGRNLQWSTFSLDELSTDVVVPCGRSKCFFPSRTDDDVGFLVAPFSSESIRETYEMVKKWDRDERDEVGEFRHFYDFQTRPLKAFKYLQGVAQPRNIELFDTMSEKLKPVFEYQKLRADGMREIVAVKVFKAPPHFLVRCRKNIKIKGGSLEGVTDVDIFQSNLKVELETLTAFVRKHPCLALDFHVLIDKEGKIYHIDFERCHVAPGKYTRMVRHFEDNCVPAIKNSWGIPL